MTFLAVELLGNPEVLVIGAAPRVAGCPLWPDGTHTGIWAGDEYETASGEVCVDVDDPACVPRDPCVLTPLAVHDKSTWLPPLTRLFKSNFDWAFSKCALNLTTISWSGGKCSTSTRYRIVSSIHSRKPSSMALVGDDGWNATLCLGVAAVSVVGSA